MKETIKEFLGPVLTALVVVFTISLVETKSMQIWQRAVLFGGFVLTYAIAYFSGYYRGFTFLSDKKD